MTWLSAVEPCEFYLANKCTIRVLIESGPSKILSNRIVIHLVITRSDKKQSRASSGANWKSVELIEDSKLEFLIYRMEQKLCGRVSWSFI